MDRRIGILFLAFLALLAIAVMRATYLGSVRAASLQRAAATQQVTNVVAPRPARRDHRPQRGAAGDQRGGRRHRRRPLPDQESGQGLARSWRRCSASRRWPCSSSDQAPHRVRVPGAPARGQPRQRDRQAPHRGHHADPDDQARVSAVVGGVAGAGDRRLGRPRDQRPRVPLRQRPARQQRRPADRQRRDRPADLDRRRALDACRARRWS